MAKSSGKQNQQMRLIVSLVGIFMLFLLIHLMVKPQEQPQALKFSEFIAATSLPEDNPDRVKEVTFKSNEIAGVRADNSTFKTYGPNDADLRKDLTARGIQVNFEPPEEMSLWKTLLVNSLPMLVLLFLFFFFMRQLQIGGGKAMSFGKSRAKMLNENQSKLTFEDVAGVEEAKEELQEIVEFLKEPKKFTKLGGRIPKGVLLVGPPGTGKTILAKAIAGEAGVPFFSISGSDFVEMFVGVGASRVRDLFDQAKKHAPCIVFIDEIDAVGRHRGAGLGGGHDEREQTLNQLLVEMDGFESNDGVILIAATNRSDVLDPALLRPGRFDRRVIVPKPDLKGREHILNVHTRKTPLGRDVELQTIAQGTPGFSGADLENLVNEAALIAARQNSSDIAMRHFDLAKDKVLMGPERKSMIISETEKRNTAYHEAGHALVAKKVKGADPVHKITIIPRGQALGVTILLPTEDRLTVSKEYAEGMIAYAMGGRAAEEVVFGHQTTGAGDDIEKATGIARKMVCSWGMSDKIGPMSLGKPDGEVFLGRDMGTQKTHSEKLAEEVDEEVRELVTRNYNRAVAILKENRTVLDKMAEALLMREVLEAIDMDRLLAGEEIISDDERRKYEENKSSKAAEHAKAASKRAANKAKNAAHAESEATPISALPQGT